MLTGQKHLVRCRCVLPQFKNRADPPQHQFPVFSVVGDDGTVQTKFVQCNNCGVVHRVSDICKSDLLVGREGSPSIITVDDVKSSLPEQLVGLLESHDADLPTYEAVKFIVENKRWGEHVVLSADVVGDERHGKFVRILGETIYRVDSFVREEYVGAR